MAPTSTTAMAVGRRRKPVGGFATPAHAAFLYTRVSPLRCARKRLVLSWEVFNTMGRGVIFASGFCVGMICACLCACLVCVFGGGGCFARALKCFLL